MSERTALEVRRRVGLVFQDPDDQLFCNTVIEDVAFGPLNLGKSAAESQAIALNAWRKSTWRLWLIGLRII